MSVTLTLRVTSDKRKPGTKPSKTKGEKVDHIIEKLNFHQVGLRLGHGSLQLNKDLFKVLVFKQSEKRAPGPLTRDVIGGDSLLDNLEKSVDLKTQIETLKLGHNFIKCDPLNKEKQEKFYFTVIIEILLDLELKSPLRSGIIRILKDFSSGGRAVDIVPIISSGLIARFSECDNNTSKTLTVTNTLCGCFDNFPLGVDAVKTCQHEAYEFIIKNLTICKDQLSCGDNFEDVNEEVCQCTHLLVRAALHLSSISTLPDPTKLHKLARELVAFKQLPLDSRTNCGLLAVVIGRCHWLQMLEEQLVINDEVTSLCVYSGLIGSLSPEEMSVRTNISSNGKTALLLMFDSIMDIYLRHSLNPTVTLSVARTLVSLSRALLAHSQLLPPLLPRLLAYCWEHLEHVMDSVKHLATSLLNNLAKMHSQDVDVHGAILAASKSLPMQSRARHTALSTLVGKVPISLLISGNEEINRLYQHLNQELISSHAVNVFQELLKQHYQEMEDKEMWKDLWIRPLLQYLNTNQSVPLQQVLSRAVTVCPEIVTYVLSLPDGDASLGTRLLCLRHAHKQGLLRKEKEDEQKWRGLIDYELLTTAVCHSEEQTRLSCLSLIVESPKTTEVFTIQELKLVMDYVVHNLNLENPAGRQRSIALLGKFVCRFNESRQVLQRQAHESAGLLQAYADCRLWLERCCLNSLFPGASFARRVTVLHLLTALGVTLVEPSTTETLLSCLADSYEELKAVAMRLLISTPGLLKDFDVPLMAVGIMEKCLEKAGDVKPPECMSAAYFLATLSQATLSSTTLAVIINKYDCSTRLAQHSEIEHKTLYYCILIVLQRLVQQLEVAKVSVLKAASSAPLYGLLFTAKLLLSQINLRQCSGPAWRKLIKELVDVSFQCSNAVSSVVNSDSPEGHLPMDFDFDPMELYGKEEAGDDEGTHGVTSQMVLLCSWRTVKEVSLLLGFLAEEATIALTPEDEGLLAAEDILRIGDHLTTLLAETKHRGAFEQAYVGFCKLVSRLWRLPSGYLKDLPQKWLEETMQEIGNENLCATRRSAGIPFMIQALITTQLEVRGPSSLEPWVTCLLDIAESPTASYIARTHSFNILRALFRSTQLGEAVGMFVEQAIIVTITAFASASWMERNSATLLLSALMTRVFGVPRSKSQDNLGWKNKMTGRIFFQRYPKLFVFFQEELKKTSESTRGNIHPTLYPVLLILGRLYPSSLEGTDSNVQLIQFIPDIQVCAGSNIYKTRVLAASACVALISAKHLDILINKLTDGRLSRNCRHGLLLQVAFYFKSSEPKTDKNILRSKAEIWIAKLLQATVQTNPSCIELEAMFQMLNSFIGKYFSLVPDELWMYVVKLSKSILKATEDSNKIANCLLRPRIYELLLKVAVFRSDIELPSLCCEIFEDKMWEVKHTVLDFITCLLSDIDCSQTYSNLPSSVTDYCKTAVLQESNVMSIFVKIVLDMLFLNSKQCYHSEDKAKILLVLWKWRRAFRKILEHSSVHSELDHLFFLIDLCRDSNEDVALNAIHCLSEYMSIKQGFQWPEEDLSAVCQLLTYLYQPEMSEAFTDLAHDLVSEHFDALQQSQTPTNRLQVYKIYIELNASSQWPAAVDQVCQTEASDEVTAVLLTALTLGHMNTNSNLYEVGRVFDKDEVNGAFEEFMLSKVCSQRLNMLPRELMSKTLTPAISEWLRAETGLKGTTLGELIAAANQELLQPEQNCPWQCLLPGYQCSRLKTLKIKNIL